jgi:hypothetical protein
VVALWLGNDPPDGWLRLSSGVEIPVGLTEALEPGRKRNDEYKGRAAPEPVEYDIQTIETQLDNAIKNKVEKYSPRPALIVHLSMGAYSRPRHEVEAAIAR